MKNYDLDNIYMINKKSRARWIKRHKNLIKDLPLNIKAIVIILYHIRRFENLSKHLSFFGFGYQTASKYMCLLRELGIVTSKQNGRSNIYEITNYGDKFCIDLFYTLRK